ncbi:MAG: hypothetical protein ACRCZP_11590 [Phycicoccus sp.]
MHRPSRLILLQLAAVTLNVLMAGWYVGRISADAHPWKLGAVLVCVHVAIAVWISWQLWHRVVFEKMLSSSDVLIRFGEAGLGATDDDQ